MSKNNANPAQSVRRSPRKRPRKLFADFVTSIDSDTSSYEVEESTSSPVFRKTKATKKIVSAHKKEKVTKTSNRGKTKKKDKDQRSNEVERMISERNKRCMVSKNYK